jgi:nitroreductase
MITTANLGSWNVSPENFPIDGGADQKLMYMLHYAILAPSTHNTQPWMFRLHGHEVDLIADTRRALPVVDPLNRELVISCGAALYNLRLAARYFGYECQVELLPEEDAPNLLARVSLGERCDTTAQDILLFEAIRRRHTNRLQFSEEAVSQEIINLLAEAAAEEGASLYCLQNETMREQVAELIAEADRIQWRDKQFRKELAAWITPNDAVRRDGIPGYADGVGDLKSQAEPLLVRTFDLGKGEAARDRQLAIYSPVLAVLGTPEDTRLDWLRAGEALAAVLLRARNEEVWASFLNQAIEIAETRSALSELLSTSGFPQILLRLGFGQEVKPTPRRSLQDSVLLDRSARIRLHQ